MIVEVSEDEYQVEYRIVSVYVLQDGQSNWVFQRYFVLSASHTVHHWLSI